MGLATIVELRPVAGDQLYDVAPLAVNTILPPWQMPGFSGVTVIGVGWVMVTLAVAVHVLASVTVMV